MKGTFFQTAKVGQSANQSGRNHLQKLTDLPIVGRSYCKIRVFNTTLILLTSNLFKKKMEHALQLYRCNLQQ